jgi:hypothetical protein
METSPKGILGIAFLRTIRQSVCGDAIDLCGVAYHNESPSEHLCIRGYLLVSLYSHSDDFPYLQPQTITSKSF